MINGSSGTISVLQLLIPPSPITRHSPDDHSERDRALEILLKLMKNKDNLTDIPSLCGRIYKSKYEASGNFYCDVVLNGFLCTQVVVKCYDILEKGGVIVMLVMGVVLACRVPYSAVSYSAVSRTVPCLAQCRVVQCTTRSTVISCSVVSNLLAL